MICNAIACYENLQLTQRGINQLPDIFLRSRLSPDLPVYYFNPEFFEEGRGEELPPSSLKISRTPTTTPSPYTMPPHVLLITDFKNFPERLGRQVKHTNAVRVEYGCQKASATGAIFYDATTKEVWVSDFGVNAEVRERRRPVIAKLQTSSVQQKKTMKLVRDLLREEAVLERARSTNTIPLYNLLDYTESTLALLTNEKDVEEAVRRWAKSRTPKRLQALRRAIQWYKGHCSTLSRLPTEISKEMAGLHKQNAPARQTVKRIAAFLETARKRFQVESVTHGQERKRVYAVIADCPAKVQLTASEIEGALNDEFFNLSRTDSGICIARLSAKLEDALLTLLYGYAANQPWANEITPEAIFACQSARSSARKCRKGEQKRSMQENEAITGTRKVAKGGDDGSFANIASGMLAWPSYNELKKQIQRWSPKIPFNIPKKEGMKLEVKEKVLKGFHGRGASSEIFSVLEVLWQNRKHIKARTFDDFVRILLTKELGVVWIEALIARQAVVYKRLQRSAEAVVLKGESPVALKEYPLVGQPCGFLLDAVCLKLRAMKRDEEWLHLFRSFLPAYMSYTFSIRETTLFLLQVLSERDWKVLLRNAGQSHMEEVAYGLFVIRTESGFRIEKYETKTRISNPNPHHDSGDFVIEGKQVEGYAFLPEFLEMLLHAFQMITGYACTAESRQPRLYISTNEVEEGWFQILQCHVFPLGCFRHGNKHFLSVEIEDLGEEMLVRQNPEELLASQEKKIAVWPSNKIEKRLKSKVVEVLVDGKRLRAPLGVVKPAVHGHRELKVPNYGSENNSNSGHIKKMLNALKGQLSSSIGKLEEGLVGPITGKPLHLSSLQLSLRLPLLFKFFGRHGSANLFLEEQAFYRGCSDPAVGKALEDEVKDLIKREAHVSRRVVEKHYSAFKTPEMKAFTSFDGRYHDRLADRWASHPDIRPASDCFPWTFLEPPLQASGSLYDRCKDMRRMSLSEQNAQLFLMQTLAEVWETRVGIDEWCESTSWKKFAGKMDLLLAEAQGLWDFKFGNIKAPRRSKRKVKRLVTASSKRAKPS